MYCTTDDVYRYSGITSTEISAANVTEFIKDAEIDVDKVTFTTYWAIETSGTATDGDDNTITDSGASFGTADELVGDYVWIYSGTGANQLQKIESHTATVITIDTDWETNPDNTSKYRIVHSGRDPRKTLTDYPGKGDRTFFLPIYPLRRLNSVSIRDTSVTTSYVRQTDPGGILVLTTDAEVSVWTRYDDPGNTIDYWYGVYPVPREVKKLTAVKAAIMALTAQMGGTFNDPTSYTLPEGSTAVGEPYVNIRSTKEALTKIEADLLKRIRKYPIITLSP